jgi:hypothetical protein
MSTRRFMTTREKRRLQAEAELQASLGPKGVTPETALPAYRAPTTSQTMIGIDQHGRTSPGSKLHAPGCFRMDNIWAASRPATQEELVAREACRSCR